MRNEDGISRRWGVTWNSWLIAAVGVFIHVSGGAVWAQKPGRVTEEDGGGLLSWGVALGIVVVVCVSAFINPKRTHRD